MNCQDLEIYLSALLDGELEASKRLLVRNHLESCRACHQEYHLLKITKALIKQNIPPEEAPAYLRNKVVQMIGEEGTKKTRQWQWPWISAWLLQPRTLIPAVAGLILVISFVVYLNFFRSTPTHLVAGLVTAHGNYESTRVPIEMITSNPRQLSAWFRGKVDFSFEVPQLEQVNLSLIGGDVLGIPGLKGVHILYHSPSGHKTSLFIFKDQEQRLYFKRVQEKGYEFHIGNYRDYAVLFWKKREMIYSLVCAGADHVQDLVHCALWVSKE